eukprot:sb/3478544/
MVTLAKGLLAPGDRRWEECTRHLRQLSGVEKPTLNRAEDIGHGSKDSQTTDEQQKTSLLQEAKDYDSTLQYSCQSIGLSLTVVRALALAIGLPLRDRNIR